MSDVSASAAEVKEQLLAIAKEMLISGLVQGTAGNVAARLPDGNVVLTPSSLDYLEMDLDDLVVCSPDGEVVEGHRGPTSEKALHLAAMRRYPEINATMHCHAKHCTMFALTRQPIPAVIEEFVVYVGGDVPVANYKTTGTDELAEEVAGMGGRPQRGAHGQPRAVRGGQEPGRRPPRRRAGGADGRDRLGRAAPG